MKLIERLIGTENTTHIFDEWSKLEHKKVETLLELTINLTGHVYTFNENTQFNAENFDEIVTRLDEGQRPYNYENYLVRMNEDNKKKILKFYEKICDKSAPTDPWLVNLVNFTTALLLTSEKDREDCRTTALVIRFKLLQQLSLRRMDDTEFKNLCEDLFDGLHYGFMYKSISMKCCEDFCEIMENYSEFYIFQTDMMEYFSHILTTETIKESTVAIKSLKKLLHSSVAVAKAVAEFIVEDLIVCLLNFIKGRNVGLVQGCIDLLILVQETLQKEKLLKETELTNILPLMVNKNEKIRNLATKLVFKNSENPLTDFIEIIRAHDFPSERIVNVIKNCWDSKIFCDWRKYIEILSTKKKFVYSTVLVTINTILKHLKSIYKPADTIEKCPELELAIEFMAVFPAWLDYFMEQNDSLDCVHKLVQIDSDKQLFAFLEDQEVIAFIQTLFRVIPTTRDIRLILTILHYLDIANNYAKGSVFKECYERNLAQLCETSTHYLKNVITIGHSFQTIEYEKHLKIFCIIASFDNRKTFEIEDQIIDLIQPELLQLMDSKPPILLMTNFLFVEKLHLANETKNKNMFEEFMKRLKDLMETAVGYFMAKQKLDYDDGLVFEVQLENLFTLKSVMNITEQFKKFAHVVATLTFNHEDTTLLKKWIKFVGRVDADESIEIIQHFASPLSQPLEDLMTDLLVALYNFNHDLFDTTIARTIVKIYMENKEILKDFLQNFISFMDKTFPAKANESNGFEMIFINTFEQRAPITLEYLEALNPLLTVIYNNQKAMSNLQRILNESLSSLENEAELEVMRGFLSTLSNRMETSE